MKTEGTNLLLITMCSRRQGIIPLGGRYRQVSVHINEYHIHKPMSVCLSLCNSVLIKASFEFLLYVREIKTNITVTSQLAR